MVNESNGIAFDCDYEIQMTKCTLTHTFIVSRVKRKPTNETHSKPRQVQLSEMDNNENKSKNVVKSDVVNAEKHEKRRVRLSIQWIFRVTIDCCINISITVYYLL